MYMQQIKIPSFHMILVYKYELFDYVEESNQVKHHVPMIGSNMLQIIFLRIKSTLMVSWWFQPTSLERPPKRQYL